MTSVQDSLSQKLREDPFNAVFSLQEQEMLDEWEVERLERFKQVGELWRASHYSVSCEPPAQWNPAAQTEEQYWTGYASMSPAVTPEDFHSEARRRVSESSTAAAKVTATA